MLKSEDKMMKMIGSPNQYSMISTDDVFEDLNSDVDGEHCQGKYMKELLNQQNELNSAFQDVRNILPVQDSMLSNSKLAIVNTAADYIDWLCGEISELITKTKLCKNTSLIEEMLGTMPLVSQTGAQRFRQDRKVSDGDDGYHDNNEDESGEESGDESDTDNDERKEIGAESGQGDCDRTGESKTKKLKMENAVSSVGSDNDIRNHGDGGFHLSDHSAEQETLNTNSGTGPRRPQNGFIRFSCQYRKIIAEEHPNLDNREVSRLLGAKWRRMTRDEKKPFADEFHEEMRERRKKFPTWNYAGNRKKYLNMNLDHDPLPNRLRPRDTIRPPQNIANIICPIKTQNDEKKRRVSKPNPILVEKSQWVQCDGCDKWRKIPVNIHLEALPDSWYCYMNPDTSFNNCSIPEVSWSEDTDVRISISNKPQDGETAGTSENSDTASIMKREREDVAKDGYLATGGSDLLNAETMLDKMVTTHAMEVEVQEYGSGFLVENVKIGDENSATVETLQMDAETLDTSVYADRSHLDDHNYEASPLTCWDKSAEVMYEGTVANDGTMMDWEQDTSLTCKENNLTISEDEGIADGSSFCTADDLSQCASEVTSILPCGNLHSRNTLVEHITVDAMSDEVAAVQSSNISVTSDEDKATLEFDQGCVELTRKSEWQLHKEELIKWNAVNSDQM